MGLISNPSIREISNIYMLANTPMFLYRHMRQLTYLENLAKNNDLEVLLIEYERRTIKKDRLPEDIAIAYAILIAIAHLEYSVALKYFSKFDLSRLKWGNEIKNIFHTRIPVETTVNFFTMPEISDTQQIRSDSVASLSSLQVRNNVTDEE
jgi:hypothetical protein